MTGIYYGDAFLIGGKCVVVFGAGKTRVIKDKIIIEEDSNNKMIINDSIRFDIKDDKLMVIPDPLMGHSKELGLSEPSIKDGYFVDYFIFNEFAVDTHDDFKKLSIDEFVETATFNINFGATSDRRPEMKELLVGQSVELYRVPWCYTPNGKAKIIQEIIS